MSSEQPVVKSLSGRDEIEGTFAVMRELRPHLVAASYVDTIERMMVGGFRLAAVQVAGEVVAVAGYRLIENLASGPHVYVDDLVTTDTGRSRGYGKLLLDWLKGAARAAGCQSLFLDSGVHRHGAHRFYLRERMDIAAYHFRVSLEK
jgi:GNAT superfamily N-acetyltransferase